MTIQTLVKMQRDYYNQGHTKTYEFREKALKQLYNSVVEHEDEIKEALYKDLNKSSGEAYLTEIGVTLKEIRFLKKHLKKLMKIKRVKSEITNFPAKNFISPSPYGVVLIMSPWNYPIFLTLAPLAGAIAAGNCVVIKPSNYSSHTQDIIEKMILSVYENQFVAVVKGGREENQELLNQKFDYIFFTGSTSVGKVVMEKAAKNLTPVSLELGGKSPTIVTEDAVIDLAAKRIAFGKLINVGQTCVAPDYVLVHKKKQEELITKLKKYITQFYGEQPLKNPDYGKIISRKHFERLVSLFKGQEVAFGGEHDVEIEKIAPTILTNVDLESEVMQEEIFGPILPIIAYDNLEEAIEIVKSKPHPLALYLFTTSKKTIHQVLNSVQFGGGNINDCIMHVASHHLPFGGVGESGMGSYHGKASFETFTHYRSLISKSNLYDLPIRYFPIDKKKEDFIKKVLK
ncbi:MAG TPA: aldehyde dehydrogenase [Bacillota bacterium]|nr:aldehyde dehydrogenase [Bacillota bacterium]